MASKKTEIVGAFDSVEDFWPEKSRQRLEFYDRISKLSPEEAQVVVSLIKERQQFAYLSDNCYI